MASEFAEFWIRGLSFDYTYTKKLLGPQKANAIMFLSEIRINQDAPESFEFECPS